MKKKLISTIVTVATMSAMAVSVSAADWSQCSYADNDPNTFKLISLNPDGVTFTTSDANPDICKARITLDKVLKNPDDYANIARMEWKVTYTGVTPELVAEAGLAGGTYATNKNSTSYQITPETDENDNFIWDKDTYEIIDTVEFTDTLPEKDGELVFMDWSVASIGEQGVQLTISDLKIYDKEGNEIEQLGYGEWVAPETTEEPTEEPTEKPAEKPVDETLEKPAESDSENIVGKEDNAETGNLSTGVAAAVLALAAASAVVNGKRMRK